MLTVVARRVPQCAAAMVRASGHAGANQRDGDVADLVPPLIEAKLAMPSARRDLVDRPRIDRVLEADGDAVLTLVSAPAGYGKTTSVRAWCDRLDAGVAWVTLDSGDDDPVRLWSYIATAVDRVRPGLGQRALQRLRVAGSPIEDVVDELTNGLAALGSGLLLVLDDVHSVTNEECISSIEYLLEDLPANARAAVITRIDPELRLAWLRAGGALAEVREGELAFTPAEAHELLVGRGRLELGADEIELLVERTEGWPAALVLAWLWLRTADDPNRAVRAFGGDHRLVAEYLSSEVLAALDDDRRSLLHGAAVLGEFTAELCDAALERTDSAHELAELERSNYFVLPLEQGGWFRLHALFADYARAELAALDPGAEIRIHRRAAEWLRSHGKPVEAILHAAAAGDHELVAELLLEYHLPLIRSGASGTLLRWVRTLPDDVLVQHQRLAALAAAASMQVGGGTIERRRLLRVAERAGKGPGPSDPYAESLTRMVRSVTVDGGVGRAVREGRRAVELSETGADEVLTAALSAYARALFFAGDLDEASAAALRALEHPDVERRTPGLVAASSTLALVAVEQGRLVAARGHAERARAAAGRIGISQSWLGGNASAALGSVLAAEGDLEGAERELASAEHLFAHEVATLHHAWVLILLARVQGRRGRLDAAETNLHAAQEALGELTDSGAVTPLAGEVQRELDAARARASSGELLEQPSAAELGVLHLLASDLSTPEIAERLFLSPHTIRSHRRALYQKLGVKNRTDAVARATALGLLEQTESPG
jgi:ATP/maltotriose-dependent transcriptional regulator MalT